jgi:hypothetical protein
MCEVRVREFNIIYPDSLQRAEAAEELLEWLAEPAEAVPDTF